MTEEEKAEEYCKNSKNFVKYTSETYKKRLKKAYLDGLAEGRKEKECNCMTYLSFKTLEKENAELKSQIDQLSNDNHVLKTSFIIQQEQIGKMKNVGNCKHSMKCAKWNEKQLNLGLMKFCLNCKDWELAN